MSVNVQKILQDPIHGTILLHPLLVKIIDTPQFQRLRRIKQLGGVEYVYPGGTGTRFSHCIGVAHMAGQYVEYLQKQQPELEIDDVDILCVKVAGLCHDLGHGPYSHLFEKFIQKNNPSDGENRSWDHEQASCDLLDIIWKNLKKDFNDYNLIETDIGKIKDMIKGVSEDDIGKKPKEEKSFLYQIVANKVTGLDVDKFDYFVRDSRTCGIPEASDASRVLLTTKVIENFICFPEKEILNLYNLFNIRFMLWKKVYQHRVVKAVEFMILDAFDAVGDVLEFTGKDGNLVPLKKAHEDITVYQQLTDDIFQRILHPDPNLEQKLKTKSSDEEKLKRAQRILRDIEERHLYRHIGDDIRWPENWERPNEEQIKESIARRSEGKITKDDLRIQIINFTYGKGEKDPVASVRFFKKGENVSKKREGQASKLLPTIFHEIIIQVYCCDREKEKIATLAMEGWKNTLGIQ